jgi:hypothetical protein
MKSDEILQDLIVILNVNELIELKRFNYLFFNAKKRAEALNVEM